MHQDLCQVLLIQDEQIGKSVGLHVGCAPVSSASRQQTDQSETTESFFKTSFIMIIGHEKLNY